MTDPDVRANDTTPASPATRPRSIPLCNLSRQAEELDSEIAAALRRVYRSGQYILGQECEQFEQAIGETLGVPHAIGCGSGSDALLLALMALGVGPGDEVLVPSYTFFATAGSVARLGAKPVFVDVEPRTLTIDPKLVAAMITRQTKAIIPVHLFGHCADMTSLSGIAQAHDIPIIEDAAQAIGASWDGVQAGASGEFGCFSFFPSKNLSACGDGGLVTTARGDLADSVRMLRVHGRRSRHAHDAVGINSRLDAMQAAILRVKLRHLARWTEQRRALAARYTELLAARGLDLVLPATDDKCQPVWNQYVVRAPAKSRDALREHLSQSGVTSEVYYSVPLHLQPCFSSLGGAPGSLPVSEQAAAEALALPMFPELAFDEQDYVVEQVAAFFGC